MDVSATIKEYKGYSTELVDVIHTLDEKIFDEPYSREKIERESSVKHNLIGPVAYDHHEPVGYKVGYELTSRLFYSWLGGVVPAYRSQGIARELMRRQHEIITGMGYQTVRTHTHNKFRDMLVLNIRNGFDVVGVIKDKSNPDTTIVLDKYLGGNNDLQNG